MDLMVLETQKWLNNTYGNDSRFTKVKEDGRTGWGTVNGLIIALQIELGFANPAPNFGQNTIAAFNLKYPEGIKEQLPGDKTESNVYAIIQGGLWCKGYSAGTGGISKHFYSGTGKAIEKLRKDMGLAESSVVTVNVMKALLSMMQFVLLSHYGGRNEVRSIQQEINRNYESYVGIIPCDGLFGREMNKALIKVLQAAEGFTPSQANGVFGPNTKSKLVTLTKSNYNSYPEFFKIATYALVCNEYSVDSYVNWTSSTDKAIDDFVNLYKLPKTNNIDVNIWMQLLISKGNPDRKALACDTRFEITEELLNKLKNDGYKIVGRYLTGGDFKEIRKGELERIINGGMKYFPIFQEYARNISEFTADKGKEHAIKAIKAAYKHRIPKTVIYFAVDLDVLDYQIDSHIIPYFKAVSENIGKGYQVGIYGSRNVCKRVCSKGYAISSFVSDMSTGFSGNLGFTIPENWNYDQFTEIKGYGGKWDLDKVAYSGKIPAVNRVLYNYEKPREPREGELTNISLIGVGEINKGTNYGNMDFISLIWHLENEYQGFAEVINSIPDLQAAPSCDTILNFLSRSYLIEGGEKSKIAFNLAIQPYSSLFEEYLKNKNNKLFKGIKKYLPRDIEAKDKILGIIDIPHFAVTTLAYSVISLAPDFWSGWGGDLATGMENVHIIMKNNSNADRQKVANSVIGSYKFDDIYLKKLNLQGAANKCNYSDLCSDADAIAIAKAIRKDKSNIHILSTTLNSYYKNITMAKRYENYFNDVEFELSSEKLTEKIYDKMTKGLVNIPRMGLKELWGKSTNEDKTACCNAFANYILSSI